MKKKTKGKGRVVFALEPTGHYWMVLSQFFEDHNQSYVLIHPLVVAKGREVRRLNKSKTDSLDAQLIGDLETQINDRISLFTPFSRRR